MTKPIIKKIQALADLVPDSMNPNAGTERGAAMLDWSLTNLGAGRSILVDRKGNVIAGNKTLDAAAEHDFPVRVIPTDGKELVVVQRIDLDLFGDNDDERNRARQLSIVDNEATLVGYKRDAEVLLTHQAGGTDIRPIFREDEISALANSLAKESGSHGKEKQVSEGETVDDFRGVFALREDVIFPSSNKWGIPDLRKEMCSQQIPNEVWGRQEITDAARTLFVHATAKFPPEASGGILAFYVDDWRFESVWTDAVMFAEDAKAFGWGAMVSPDFSVWRDDPAAVQLWNIYRSRWVARYWQEVGIPVIPSLNWSDERSYEFAHLGIPNNLPVVSVQCRTTRSRAGRDYFVKGLADAIEQLQPENVLIYGGSDHRSWMANLLPERSVYHWLESWTSERRKRVFNKEKSNET